MVTKIKDHPVLAFVIAIGIVAGGCWSILQAEDRWNQEPECVSNHTTIEEVKLDVAANRKVLIQQSASSECSSWSQMVIFLQERLEKNPNDRALKARLRDAIRKEKEACARYQRLLMGR